jgi:hypothetical protein
MTERKLRKRFYRQEKVRLQKRIFRIRVIINDVLKESFGRRLYNLKHDDELRLLILYVWRDRYKVSIRWMLKFLIKIWSKKFSRFKIKSALGCRVATLVGNKSEEIIKEKIWKEFPNNENKKNWIQSEQDKILSLIKPLKDKRKKVRTTSILQAKNPQDFIRRYKKEIRWKNKEKRLSSRHNKQLKELKRKTFRDNPWQS